MKGRILVRSDYDQSIFLKDSGQKLFTDTAHARIDK